MSTAETNVDLKAGLAQWLGTLTHFYCNDLNAIPDDKFAASPGGVARSPKDITAEVVSLCGYCTGMLKGQDVPHGPEVVTEITNRISSKADAMNELKAATSALGAAITGAGDDVFTRMVTPPWQMEDTAWNVTGITVNHIWYHDGQLNLIQAMNGDDQIHWMEG